MHRLLLRCSRCYRRRIAFGPRAVFFLLGLRLISHVVRSATGFDANFEIDHEDLRIIPGSLVALVEEAKPIE